MRSKNYYRVRALVRATFWAGVFFLLYLLATHMNYTEDGYCWGTITECYFGGK